MMIQKMKKINFKTHSDFKTIENQNITAIKTINQLQQERKK